MDTTFTTRIQESRARLVQQGSQFFQQTTEAGTELVNRTRKAGTSFVHSTKKAGEAFATQTKDASVGLAAGVKEEANLWVEHLRTQGLLPPPRTLGEGKPTVNGVPSPKLPNPRAIERLVLAQIETALEEVSDRVQKRIEWLETQIPQQLPAEVSPKNGSTPANGAMKPPISQYDELSAKDIVARLERLTDDKAAAVLAYESAHKKRATILRAAEQRLANAE